MIWLVRIPVASQIKGRDTVLLSQRAGGLLRPGEATLSKAMNEENFVVSNVTIRLHGEVQPIRCIRDQWSGCGPHQIVEGTTFVTSFIEDRGTRLHDLVSSLFAVRHKLLAFRIA